MNRGLAKRMGVIAAALFVSVMLAAESAAADSELLPVATVTIYPGETITDAMLANHEFPVGTASSYPVVASQGELTGKIARRTILPGKLIATNAVSEPELIARGRVVRAVFENGGLVIATTVLALQSGSLGDLIQVRNIDSGKIIVGAVEADGTVRVGSP